MNGFIEGRQGGRKQGTPHAQWDMRGISPAICREGLASIYFFKFPNQIFFELVNRNEGACLHYAIQQSCWQDNKKTRNDNKIQKQRYKGYKRIDKFNINNLRSEQQQPEQRNIAAREAALQNLGIKQRFGYTDHARIYDFAECVEDAPIHTIDASIAPAPITVTEYRDMLYNMLYSLHCYVT